MKREFKLDKMKGDHKIDHYKSVEKITGASCEAYVLFLKLGQYFFRCVSKGGAFEVTIIFFLSSQRMFILTVRLIIGSIDYFGILFLYLLTVKNVNRF